MERSGISSIPATPSVRLQKGRQRNDLPGAPRGAPVYSCSMLRSLIALSIRDKNGHARAGTCAKPGTAKDVGFFGGWWPLIGSRHLESCRGFPKIGVPFFGVPLKG